MFTNYFELNNVKQTTRKYCVCGGQYTWVGCCRECFLKLEFGNDEYHAKLKQKTFDRYFKDVPHVKSK